MNYKKGNLLKMFDNNEFDGIAHQCNLVGAYGGFCGLLCKKYSDIIQNLKRHANNPKNFGHVSYAHVKKDGNYTGQKVWNLFSQYYTGSPNNSFLPNTYIIDNFETRSKALFNAIVELKTNIETLIANNDLRDYKKNPYKLAIPLIASGLAADLERKKDMTDLQYFENYVYPIIKLAFVNKNDSIQLTVVHL